MSNSGIDKKELDVVVSPPLRYRALSLTNSATQKELKKKLKKLKKVLDKKSECVIHSPSPQRTTALRQLVFESKGKGKKNSQSSKNFGKKERKK